MILADKVVLITGGSKGLGLAAALEFARNGAAVVITGRGQEALDAAVADAERQGLALAAIQGDVSVEEDCRRTVEEVLSRHGRIDVLFNNAGIMDSREVERCSISAFGTTTFSLTVWIVTADSLSATARPVMMRPAAV